MSSVPADEVRIVVITAPTSLPNRAFAQRILAGLALEQIVTKALLIVEPRPPRPDASERWRRLLHRPAPRRLAAILLRRALAVVAPAPEPVPADPWIGMAERVHRVGPLNGPVMLEALCAAKPDYLVLAGLGILNADALAIPRRGTFNVHPGLLPWVRGVSVVERAIERGVPVGVTAHYVNSGIDTGAIIQRELIPAQPHDTLASLEQHAYHRCTQLMVALVAAAARGQQPVATPQIRRYPYCKEMSAEIYGRTEETVRQGRAVRLYREWLAFYGSHILPPVLDRSPPLGIAPLPLHAGIGSLLPRAPNPETKVGMA
jgi:hypothetical protein